MFPNWGIVVILNRLPIINIDVSTILLYDEVEDPRIEYKKNRHEN